MERGAGGRRREEGQTPHNGRVTGDRAGEGCAGEGRELIISQDWISCFQM